MLTPSMLVWLELAVFLSRPNVYDRAVAGFSLYCALGRLRCSDANRTRHSSLIGRFVEGAFSRTKTAKSKEKATSFIPSVVPAFGLLGRNWYVEFLLARAELGSGARTICYLSNCDFEFVLFPEYASLAYDLQRRIGSVELTDRLRGILSIGLSREQLEPISSHSLKGNHSVLHEYLGV